MRHSVAELKAEILTRSEVYAVDETSFTGPVEDMATGMLAMALVDALEREGSPRMSDQLKHCDAPMDNGYLCDLAPGHDGRHMRSMMYPRRAPSQPPRSESAAEKLLDEALASLDAWLKEGLPVMLLDVVRGKFFNLRAALRSAPAPEDVRFIRCMTHRAVPQINATEATGAECGACIMFNPHVGVAKTAILERDQAEEAEREMAEELRTLRSAPASPEPTDEAVEEEVLRVMPRAWLSPFLRIVREVREAEKRISGAPAVREGANDAGVSPEPPTSLDTAIRKATR